MNRSELMERLAGMTDDKKRATAGNLMGLLTEVVGDAKGDLGQVQCREFLVTDRAAAERALSFLTARDMPAAAKPVFDVKMPTEEEMTALVDEIALETDPQKLAEKKAAFRQRIANPPKVLSGWAVLVPVSLLSAFTREFRGSVKDKEISVIAKVWVRGGEDRAVSGLRDFFEGMGGSVQIEGL